MCIRDRMSTMQSDFEMSRKTLNLPFCFCPGALSLHRAFTECCDDLGSDVEVGVYFSKVGGDVASWHFDNNHNITIQLTGSKDWLHIPGSTNTVASRSLAGEPSKNRFEQQCPLPSTGPDSYTCYALTPGSVLYVPPGHWHQVVPTVGDSLSVDIRIGNVVDAKRIAEAVFAGLLEEFSYATDPTPRHLTSGDSLSEQVKHITEHLPRYLNRNQLPRSLPCEARLSDGMNRGASITYLLTYLLRNLPFDGPEKWLTAEVCGLNPLVAIQLKRSKRGGLGVCLSSVSSLTNMEYLRFTITVSMLLEEPLKRLMRDSKVQVLEFPFETGRQEGEFRILIRVLEWARVVWFEGQSSPEAELSDGDVPVEGGSTAARLRKRPRPMAFGPSAQRENKTSVSYTHLTLPTKRIV
eukprot:TRINITY_DN1093_c0_g1_i1.p1 TRINITY_DN1093_c0_g1~~TRINITY_DN1093_c0_g1_i1.p1  ORF type:complete len:408 (-),score=54.60 TRINITY_DN1093_c0_g1_i1:112-1335(-)